MARNKKAPGSFERRGHAWRWRVCVGGAYHRFTFRTTERQEAERCARREYEKLDRQAERKADGLTVGAKFSGLIAYFEEHRIPRLAPGTQCAYKDSLKPIREFFLDTLGDPVVERVRSAHVTQFLDWRRGHRLSGKGALHNRTLAKDRAVLHRMFEVAQDLEWREGNPVARVDVEKADKRQPVILTVEQLETLLTQCTDPMVRLFVLMCAETGARCESEALWVRWTDVDLEGGYLTIESGRDGHRTKGGRSRSTPLTPRLIAALRDHFAAYRFAAYDGRRPEYLFHHTRTLRHHVAGERITSLRRAVTEAAVRAKLPAEWTTHDLRHRRVTTWLAEGKSAVLVREAVGHADLRTTMHYTHMVKENLRALVEPVAPPATGGQTVGQNLGISGAQ